MDWGLGSPDDPDGSTEGRKPPQEPAPVSSRRRPRTSQSAGYPSTHRPARVKPGRRRSDYYHTVDIDRKVIIAVLIIVDTGCLGLDFLLRNNVC